MAKETFFLGGITAAYSGVHEIYQIALAAYETGRLDRLYCSLLDAPGKWGRLLSCVLGTDALTNRRCPGLPPKLVREYPWPILWHVARERWRTDPRTDWFDTNDWFDRHVASAIERSGSRVFVGAETCAEHSLRAAKAGGMKTILECAQVHPAFLWNLLSRAAEELDLPPPPPIDSPKMASRKSTEYEIADIVLVLSEVQKRSFLEQGFAAERLVEIPLWADRSLWYPPLEATPIKHGPLQVLFVGSVELRKGIPYLLQAARQCKQKIELTLVGTRSPLAEPYLEKHADDFQHVAPKTKRQLREIYWRSDVLVLPSLVDAFGFVAMEAMACGLPVIVTENCGVPVPHPSWRIPIMDASAIAERLLLYANDRPLCREHGRTAMQFARTFSPCRYRHKLQNLFVSLL